MNAREKYVYERQKLSYEKSLNGEMFEKVRAVILKDGKVAFIRDLSNNVITIPGGGKEENETTEEAVAREAFEETGIIIKPIMAIETNSYDVPMTFEGKDFISKRVVYIYLCEIENRVDDYSFLEGEYAGKTEIFFGEIDLLSQCKVSEVAIERIKKYCKTGK